MRRRALLAASQSSGSGNVHPFEFPLYIKADETDDAVYAGMMTGVSVDLGEEFYTALKEYLKNYVIKYGEEEFDGYFALYDVDRYGIEIYLEGHSGKWFKVVSLEVENEILYGYHDEPSVEPFIAFNDTDIRWDFNKNTSGALWERIQYTTFDGTQIYDTQQYGDNTTTIKLKFKRSGVTTAAYLFGCAGTSTTRLNAYLNSNGYWRYGNYGKIFNTRTLNIYEAEVTPTKIAVNDVVGEFTSNIFTTPHTMSLGGYTTSSGTRTAGYKGYIYYFKIYKDNVLVVDLIPVKRKSDGVECFWDRVTESFVEPLA